MVTVQEEAKRIKIGQSITDYSNQLDNLEIQKIAIKTALTNLKTQMSTDEIYNAEDIAEVTAVIAKSE